MKPKVLICMGLVWLGAVVAFFVAFKHGGFGIALGEGGTFELGIAFFILCFVLLGWLVPLSIGVLRLLRKSN